MLSMSHLHLVPDTFGGIFQACTGKLPHMVLFEYIRIIVYQYALPTSLASDSPCHWNLGVKISNNVYKYFHFQYTILEESKLHERFQPEWYFVPTKHKIFKGVYFDVQQCSRKTSERSRLHINTMGQGHWERLKVKFPTSVKTEGWTFALSVIPSLWYRSFLLFSLILRKSYLD